MFKLAVGYFGAPKYWSGVLDTGESLRFFTGFEDVVGLDGEGDGLITLGPEVAVAACDGEVSHITTSGIFSCFGGSGSNS